MTAPVPKPQFRRQGDLGCQACKDGSHENCVAILNPDKPSIDSEDSWEPGAYCECYRRNAKMHWVSADIHEELAHTARRMNRWVRSTWWSNDCGPDEPGFFSGERGTRDTYW